MGSKSWEGKYMIDAFLDILTNDASKLALEYWDKGFEVDKKPDRSLVTEADIAIERMIRDRISATYPNDGILGEEHGIERVDAERLWVIDPIDGTQAFVMGVPVFSILIALVESGQVTQAVADFPAMGSSIKAARGKGANFNGKPSQASDCKKISEANLTATSTTMFQGADQDPFLDLVKRTSSVRYGLDAFGFCSIARGRVDLVVEACLQPYDYMAPSLIVEEAGGVMTDWSGAPLSINSNGKVIAAATPELHKSVKSLLGN